MAKSNYTLYVDWNNDGDFSDSNENLSSYLLQLKWDRGRDFASNLKGESVSGELTAELLNTSSLFSPFNTGSALYGNIVPARKVTLNMGSGAFTYTFPIAFNQTVWTGFLQTIVPFPDLNGKDVAQLKAIGALGYLNTKEISVAPQTNRRTDLAIGDILDSAGWGAGDRDLDTGDTTITRFTIPKNTLTIDALRKVENSENGFVSETRDGNIKYEKRKARLEDATATTSQATMSDATSASNFSFTLIRQEDSLNNIFNEILAPFQQYTTAGSPTTVWTHSETGSSSTSIVSGDVRIFRAIYPQPDAAVNADSIDTWTTPASGTDYVANTAADGSGSTISGDLAVSVTKTANYMDIQITNNNANTAYLTTLQARGTVVTKNDTTMMVKSDSTSQTTFGKRTFNADAPFIPTSVEASNWCAYNLAIYKDPLQNIKVSFIANRNSATLDNTMSLDISNRITLDAHTKTGLFAADKDFFIESESHFVDRDRTHTVEYQLSPASALGRFWVLGVSKLELETYIGY